MAAVSAAASAKACSSLLMTYMRPMSTASAATASRIASAMQVAMRTKPFLGLVADTIPLSGDRLEPRFSLVAAYGTRYRLLTGRSQYGTMEELMHVVSHK